MPTVLRHGGFSVRVLLPPREHGPPHVHVYRAGAVVTIDLPTKTTLARVRDVIAMRDADVIAAMRLVETHADMLHAQWTAYHG